MKKKKEIEKKCKNCVCGDTLIIIDNCVKRIDEARNAKKTFVNNKWEKILNWQFTGKKETLQITTTLGLQLKLTKDHLIATPNGWVQANKIKINDELICLKEYQNKNFDLISAEDALFIGAITGDGWIGHYKQKEKILTGIGFGFSAQRYEDWKPMLEYASLKFNSKEKIHFVKNTKSPFIRIDWRNKKAEEFQKLFNKNHIPDIVWKSSKTIWGSYLKGLFSTDGCLSCTKSQIQIMFYQTTKSLICEVQMMLRMMGIYSYLTHSKRPPHKDLWCITIGRIESVTMFQKNIGFVDFARNLKLNKFITEINTPKSSRYKTIRKVNKTERVKSIELLEESNVYDMSVDKEESFFANGILVHNCLLYDDVKEQCKVAILINGEQIHLPVSPEDNCHMDELGIPVEQVRWWVEDPRTGKPTDGKGIVKIEYPEGFFGENNKK